MPNTILVKKSGTASAVPSALSYGELALNYADGKLFYKNAAGSIVSLTANSGLNAKLDALTFNGSTTTFNLTSGSVAVTPANANCLLISLNGVIQEPGVSFTLSGSQITFSVAPASTDVFFGVHLTGGAVGGGGSAGGDTVINTPAQITANQNNYALPSADIVRLSSDATRVITGFEADAGAVVTLYNVGSFDIRIDHEDTASTAANRVTSATGADVVIAPNDSITLAYDNVSSRWRTAGSVKAAVGQVAVYEFTRTSAPTDATGSSGSYTWSIPAAARYVDIYAVGPGGGGGSGRRGAAGSARFGGGGGASGSVCMVTRAADDFPQRSLSITIGAGGVGGAARTTNDTDGNAGGFGNDTLIQSGSMLLYAQRGNGGGAGTASAGTGGSAGGASMFPGVNGSSSSITGTPTGANGTNWTAGGGGAGGGISAGNVSYDGAIGRANGPTMYGTLTNTLGGTAPGGAGQSVSAVWTAGVNGFLGVVGGSGGGGAAGNASTAGGAGGNGASYGGAGGGGGASFNGFNSGAGGTGGDGYVRITVWF